MVVIPTYNRLKQCPINAANFRTVGFSRKAPFFPWLRPCWGQYIGCIAFLALSSSDPNGELVSNLRRAVDGRLRPSSTQIRLCAVGLLLGYIYNDADDLPLLGRCRDWAQTT